MKPGLFDYLKEYGDSDRYPFHMPGHKGNVDSGALASIYPYDITEIEGFDNLHQPQSIIRDAQMRAAELYHSEDTYFLVGGSTAGILSAVAALSGRGNILLIARNCHRAVYHAAVLNRMELRYIYPSSITDFEIAGAVDPGEVEQQIQAIGKEKNGRSNECQSQIAGVVITSPTYDGITSNVWEIAQIVHRYGIPLIVDQAHGAHFGIHPAYPPNAVTEGADLVVHSVHKTLPAPTQTALLHRNGSLVQRETLEKYLRIYQTSSPSYLLMAGIDEAIHIAAEEGRARLEKLLHFREKLLHSLSACRYLQVCPCTEPGKLIIAVRNLRITGQELNHMLREKYHLQMEMAERSYVTAILTMMDTEDGINRLGDALLQIDEELAAMAGNVKVEPRKIKAARCLQPEVKKSLWEAYRTDGSLIELQKAKGRIAADFVNLYPPGIPLLVPGEAVDEQMIELIEGYQNEGYSLQGLTGNRIYVLN